MRKITSDDLQVWQARERDLILINVLPEEQFITEHIPGSESVPLEAEDFVDRVRHQVKDAHRKIVVYCSSKQCDASEKAARKLEEAGFDNVYDFEGGIQEWKQARLPFESGSVYH